MMFFRPIPPPGYICYGDFIILSALISSYDGYKCIHSRYININATLSSTIQEFYWNDDGSGADDDVQVNKISTNGYPNQYYRSSHIYDSLISNPHGSFALDPISNTSIADIKSIMNNKCLDVINGLNISGTNVQMYECNNENAQKWYYNPSTQQFKTIYGKCLDLVDGNNDDGTNIQIFECNDGDGQKWLINPDGTISNINGGCLDIWEYNHDNGANVALYTCHNGRNQIWISSIFGIHNDVLDWVASKYAPILKFDRDASGYGYPMNAQLYIDNNCDDGDICENNNLDISSNPTYYRLLSSSLESGNFDILFWWFYGYQHPCAFGEGSHRGDWERIVIHINNWQISSVAYHQHGGHYEVFNFDNDIDIFINIHTIVFVGKIAHGSYFDNRDEIGGGCGYFYDWRNPGPSLWTLQNVINLETSTQDWIINNIKVPRDCCANPLTDIDNTYGCDDCGCNYEDCNSDWELLFNPLDCIAC